MRLKVTQSEKAAHSDVVTALGWSVLNELYTCGDDRTIQKWNLAGEHEGKAISLDCYATSLHWFPLASRKQSTGASDLLVLGCTDGGRPRRSALLCCAAQEAPAAAAVQQQPQAAPASLGGAPPPPPAGSFKLLTKAGRLERSVEAHRGAVTCIRWSCDGARPCRAAPPHRWLHGAGPPTRPPTHPSQALRWALTPRRRRHRQRRRGRPGQGVVSQGREPLHHRAGGRAGVRAGVGGRL